jgi:hypothetical protein
MPDSALASYLGDQDAISQTIRFAVHDTAAGRQIEAQLNFNIASPGAILGGNQNATQVVNADNLPGRHLSGAFEISPAELDSLMAMLGSSGAAPDEPTGLVQRSEGNTAVGIQIATQSNIALASPGAVLGGDQGQQQIVNAGNILNIASIAAPAYGIADLLSLANAELSALTTWLGSPGGWDGGGGVVQAAIGNTAIGIQVEEQINIAIASPNATLGGDQTEVQLVNAGNILSGPSLSFLADPSAPSGLLSEPPGSFLAHLLSQPGMQSGFGVTQIAAHNLAVGLQIEQQLNIAYASAGARLGGDQTEIQIVNAGNVVGQVLAAALPQAPVAAGRPLLAMAPATLQTLLDTWFAAPAGGHGGKLPDSHDWSIQLGGLEIHSLFAGLGNGKDDATRFAANLLLDNGVPQDAVDALRRGGKSVSNPERSAVRRVTS